MNIQSSYENSECFRIRFENDSFVLQLFYEKESPECEAQIRITNILINPPLKRKGLSKTIMKELLNYCKNHQDMSFWVFDVINQSWCNYLISHGAKLVQEGDAYSGAILWIENWYE